MFFPFYDKYLYPLRVVDADQAAGQKTFRSDRQMGNQLVVDEGSGNVVVTIEDGLMPQTYWAHKDTSSAVSNWPGLFTAIENELNAQLTQAYAIETRTPGSSDIPDCGLRLIGSASFTVRFSDPATTLDPRVLGFPEGQSADVGSNALDNIKSPVSYFGAWFPYDDSGAGAVIQDHRREPYTIQASSDSSSEAYSIGWNTDQRRRNDFLNLAGPHVFWTRGNYSDETTRAGLADGDTNNALEDLWQQSNILRSGTESDILVIYGNSNTDIGVDSSGQWEAVKLGQESERREFFGGVVSDLEGGEGERYQVKLTTDIVESHWDF